MNEWLKAALLGTEKTDLPQLLEQLPPVIQARVGQLSGEEAETVFLRTSALLLSYYRAGKEFAVIPSGGTVAPAESLSYAPKEANQLLAALLTENHILLLSDWLTECARRSRILAPHFLPQLFTLSEENVYLQFKLRAVMGERGRWLAEKNESWQILLQSTEEIWETGKAGQRKQLLRYLLEYDYDQARRLLRDTWKSESAADRFEFLNMWSGYLSSEDIQFLENIREQDKSKKVSDLALVLLIKQAESTLTKNLHHTCRALFSRRDTGILGIGSAKIDVHPNAAQESLVEELALEKESLDKSFSDQEFQTFQLLALVNPQLWEEHLGLSLDKIVRQVMGTKELKKYRPALAKAIIFHQNRAWADAWLQQFIASDDRYTQWQEDALALLSIASSETLIRLFQAKSLASLFSHSHLMELLEGLHFPWTLEFSRAVMQLLYQAYAERGVYYHEMDNLLRLSLRLHPEILSYQQEFLPQENEKRETWRAMTADLFRIITLKSKIQASFDA